NPAGQGEAAEIDDRFPAADRGEVAEVAVTERRRRPLAGNAGGDDTGDIGALLLGDRRDAGECTLRTLNLSGVANNKDLRVVWEAQIGRHRDAAAAARLNPQPVGCRGRGDPRRPDQRVAVDAL